MADTGATTAAPAAAIVAFLINSLLSISLGVVHLQFPEFLGQIYEILPDNRHFSPKFCDLLL
jgi:hypothetical protein